ncbi:HDOD domain-containing protein [Mucisphaera calidilacus]|uniref:histidine kinase n=1 Tax=Mucisphaera calidilacus TaxID=2527982 RepID=A0A518BT80_9BACT|nr:HDOD domain-containing protein [Mucisphaera calidilacus]QDU70183.1 Sensor protein ZraS [Mucisphaera calidilacus]
MPEAAAPAAQLDDARRAELILRKVDSLPTLPSVATRLLDLTAREDAEAGEVISLVKSDPALTSRILAMCRTADKGVSNEVLTIDRAVVLLGFSAIRNVVLSLQVGRYFEQMNPDTEQPAEAGLDRTGLWIHSLAVAVTAELIAELHPERKELRADQAFVCGLLHDLGKLTLDYVLPRSYGKVLRVAEERQCGLAEVEKRVLGIDHLTAGKRISETWGLPDTVRDVMWQHALPAEALRDQPSGAMVQLVALANALVRSLHLGVSGSHGRRNRTPEYAEALGIEYGWLDRISTHVVERIETLSETLGIGAKPSVELLLDSVRSANAALARMNQSLERKSVAGTHAERTLAILSRFQKRINAQHGLAGTLVAVSESARVWAEGQVRAAWFFADGHRGTIWGGSWFRFDDRLEPVNSGRVDPPASCDLEALGSMWGVPACESASWLVRASGIEENPGDRLVVLGHPATGYAILIANASRWPAQQASGPLLSAWSTAIAAASAYERTQRLNEDLVRVGAELSEAQDELVRNRSMARLGEVTAGAAHEMNNPLTVLSGRAQLLAMKCKPGSDEHKSAQVMMKASEKLTDLITSLHILAKPQVPMRSEADLGQIIQVASGQARDLARAKPEVELGLQIPEGLPKANIDPEQIRGALVEVICNAFEAPARALVRVSLELGSGGRRALILVRDDGPGMDLHTLEHACDPFFSSKAAGRRTGMGLSRARAFINGHDGRLELDSIPGQGTTVTLHLPLDRQG